MGALLQRAVAGRRCVREGGEVGPGERVREPLWRSQSSDHEPVLFIQEEGQPL
jgi:hypothetical protein